MAALNPAKFIREVRQEMRRVSWPSGKETRISTFMVLSLAALAAVFFVVVYVVAGSIIQSIIGI